MTTLSTQDFELKKVYDWWFPSTREAIVAYIPKGAEKTTSSYCIPAYPKAIMTESDFRKATRFCKEAFGEETTYEGSLITLLTESGPKLFVEVEGGWIEAEK